MADKNGKVPKLDGENCVSQPDAPSPFRGAGDPMLPQNGRGELRTNEVTSSRGCSFYKDAPENIVAAMPTDRDSWYYNMSHKKRGIAVIFNHENFTSSKLKARCGTKTDCNQLESVLRSLRFEVRSYFDASLSQVMKVIHEVRNEDHSENDCFLMAVLSHGEQNIIHAHDSPYQPEDLWHPFTAEKCPSLAGKPKLFFIQVHAITPASVMELQLRIEKLEAENSSLRRELAKKVPVSVEDVDKSDELGDSFIGKNLLRENDIISVTSSNNSEDQLEPIYDVAVGGVSACQGDKLDPGVTLMKRTETDSGPMSYRIPVHADFLIAYSTIPGFYSWRNTQRGSWFMQALCEELKKHCYSLDLLTILTFVNRRVATDYQSNVPGNNEMDAQKQIPCITYMLTRLLKFEPK